MAMQGSGGGYGSRQHVEKSVRTGTGASAVGPGGVSQLGNKVGSHVTKSEESRYTGDPFYIGRGLNPTPYGNEVSARTQCGPGGSRTVQPLGGQGRHGDVAGTRPGPGRGILDNS